MRVNISFTQAAVVLIVAATTASSATADWSWKHFWHGLHVGYYRNHAWPDPFTEADAAQVVIPFDVMKANGWRMHNTIGHDLFRDGDGALLASGHKRVHWIATQAPPTRRTVYVLRGDTQAETDARVAAVRQTLTSLPTDAPPPEVMITDVEPAASSGAWATKINREWLEHLTAPRLPQVSASGISGGTQTTSD